MTGVRKALGIICIYLGVVELPWEGRASGLGDL